MSLACLFVLVAVPASVGEHLRSNSQLQGDLDLAQNAGLQLGPCHCQIDSKAWVRPTRTTPRCVFIDLGAGGGKDLDRFANNTYGPVSNCPNGGDWEAILIEANPSFKTHLDSVSQKHGQHRVHIKASTAAYMCEAKAAFYLDTKDYKAQALPGRQLNKVEVQTLNINRLLTESVIPGDWVLMKMDVEGAEFDIIPCMAQAPAATLVDRLYVQEHNPSWGLEGATQSIMQTAMSGLRTRGIDIPAFTPE